MSARSRSAAQSIATGWAGWTSTRQMPPRSTVARARPTRPMGRHLQPGLPARDGWQQPVRRSAALGHGIGAPVPRLGCARHDRRTAPDRGRPAVDPARRLVIVASKSGGTVEVASMERYFRAMTNGRGTRQPDASSSRSRIPAPGSITLRARGYRDAFRNPADIGGRYSALSLFGLVPTALIGAPPDLLTAASRWPTAAARTTTRTPDSSLARSSPRRRSTDATNSRWRCPIAVDARPGIEQLIAESTASWGKGALPVVDERPAARTITARTPPSSPFATERDASDKVAMSACRRWGTGSQPDHQARRARRRVLRWGLPQQSAAPRCTVNYRSTNRTSPKRRPRPCDLLETFAPATGSRGGAAGRFGRGRRLHTRRPPG